MSSLRSEPRVVRFGVFEVDISAGELRKQGRLIKLQEQPLQVLELLLSRPGEVVTREEMQQALWPADTFVEFDQGLNTAIKKIRTALGDSAENPRFIETIPRKGYRFIAPVQGYAAPSVVALRTGRRRFWPTATVSAIVVIGGCVLWLHVNQRREPAPAPVPLTSYPGSEVLPSFSPDGNQVAFAWNTAENPPIHSNFDIYLKLIDGSEAVRLTHDPADDLSPAWSPDGRYIAFLRTLSADRMGVFLIPAIGGRERKLAEVDLNLEESVAFPGLSWFPDGKWLAVMDKASPGEPTALFLLSADSGDKRRLTSPPLGIPGDETPSVSRDGRAVVFTRSTSKNIGDLFVLQLSEDLTPKDEPDRLTFDNRYSAYPAWTPDGREIVFTSGRPHTPGLWSIQLSRPGSRVTKPERLAFTGEGVMQPAISRQGRLAYTQFTVDVDIWKLDLNGGHPTNGSPVDLISSTRIDHDAQYSPDGSRIVFSSNRSGSFELWVCNSDGSNPVQLTSFTSPYYMSSPMWSPDGGLIYFHYHPDGKPSVYMIGSGGGRPKRLGLEGPDAWSRDGKWIYFTSNRSGRDQIWKMTPSGGDAVQVTKNGGSGEVESPDRHYLYYLKTGTDGKTGLWRLPLGGGDETQVLESILNSNFAVTDRGIYFIPDSKPFSVRFLSFDSGEVVRITDLKHEPGYGFSVSPDGRSLLYAGYEAIRSDLMLVEKFR